MTRTSASVVTSIGLEREAALGQRRQRVALGQPGVDEAEPAGAARRGSPAPPSSRRGAPAAMLRRMCGSCCSFGLSTSPRSPPVQETTSTSTPSATYLAIVAAPLLDSSSGCACTAISRSRSPTWHTCSRLEPVIADNGAIDDWIRPSSRHRACGRPDEGLPVPLPRPAPGTAKWWVVGRRRRASSASAWPSGGGWPARSARSRWTDLGYDVRRRPQRAASTYDVHRPRPTATCPASCAPWTATTAPSARVTVTVPAGAERVGAPRSPSVHDDPGRDRRRCKTCSVLPDRPSAERPATGQRRSPARMRFDPRPSC